MSFIRRLFLQLTSFDIVETSSWRLCLSMTMAIVGDSRTCILPSNVDAVASITLFFMKMAGFGRYWSDGLRLGALEALISYDVSLFLLGRCVLFCILCCILVLIGMLKELK